MRALKRGRFGALVLLFAAGGLLFGCGHHYDRTYLKSKSALDGVKRVGVLPFQNLTKFPDAGEIIADLFTTELYRLGRFRVVERTQIHRILRDQETALPEVIDRTYAQELGKRLGLDGVFIGSVSEYWYRLERRRWRREEGEEPAVGINARLVKVDTGEVIWATSDSRSSYDIFSVDRDHINRVAQITVHSMAETLR